jgi:hypothetical protein
MFIGLDLTGTLLLLPLEPEEPLEPDEAGGCLLPEELLGPGPELEGETFVGYSGFLGFGLAIGRVYLFSLSSTFVKPFSVLESPW